MVQRGANERRARNAAAAVLAAGAATLLSSALWFLAGSVALPGADACKLQGYDSGVCKPAQDIQDRMPFCADVVRYTACVPREVPWYPNLTIDKKDAWARQTYSDFIDLRIRIEKQDITPMDPTMYTYSVDGQPAEKRFTSSASQDCMDAYRNFMCWMNFPRCDVSGNSLQMCRSVCENMMRACKYPKVLWRCYNPEYYGGKDPEGAVGDQLYTADGTAEFVRAPFPGLPFRDNEFDEEDDTEPLVVCTPSLRNDAGRGPSATWGAVAAAAALVVGVALHGACHGRDHGDRDA